MSRDESFVEEPDLDPIVQGLRARQLWAAVAMTGICHDGQITVDDTILEAAGIDPVAARDRERRGLVRAPDSAERVNAGRVAAILDEQGPVSAEGIADALGVSIKTVLQALWELRRAGGACSRGRLWSNKPPRRTASLRDEQVLALLPASVEELVAELDARRPRVLGVLKRLRDARRVAWVRRRGGGGVWAATRSGAAAGECS